MLLLLPLLLSYFAVLYFISVSGTAFFPVSFLFIIHVFFCCIQILLCHIILRTLYKTLNTQGIYEQKITDVVHISAGRMYFFFVRRDPPPSFAQQQQRQ